MSKIQQMIQDRVTEVATETARGVENKALDDLHILAGHMSQIADQTRDSIAVNRKQIAMLRTMMEQLVLKSEKPVHWTIWAILGGVILVISLQLTILLQSPLQLGCRPVKGGMICTRI